MTKKIIKISLFSVAILGLLFICIYYILYTPKTFYYNQLWSSSTGISFNNQTNTNKAIQPYTYINIPKLPETPLALIVNQSKPDKQSPPNNNSQEQTPKPQQSTDYPVIALDMSDKQTTTNLLCKNDSKYSPDINLLAKKEYPLKKSAPTSTNTSEPVVLILHTHGSECYMPEDQKNYNSNTPTRLYDINNNIVAVGKVLADTLNNLNVPTIHCDTMFDADSYSDSYNLSEKAIEEYLEKYPSIQYIFDVHRDSIIKTNNDKIKPLTLIENTPTAQAMFVVGTDSSGADHPNWMDNLTVASIFQYKLIEKYQTLMRPINIRAASFNAEQSIGSILIEIGTCGNTLSEAKNCAKFLGQTIAEVILNDGI